MKQIPTPAGRAAHRKFAAVATLSLVLPALGLAASSQAAAATTTGVEVRWLVTDDWGSGFQASAEIINHSGATIDPWQVQFSYPQSVTSLWDGVYSSAPGGFKVAGPNWAKSLAPGGSTRIGLVGKRLVPGSLSPASCAGAAGSTCAVTVGGVPGAAHRNPYPDPHIVNARAHGHPDPDPNPDTDSADAHPDRLANGQCCRSEGPGRTGEHQ